MTKRCPAERVAAAFLASTVILSITGMAPASAESAQNDSRLFPSDERVLEFGTQERNITVAPFVQFDGGYYDQDPGRSAFGSSINLARIYLFGAYDAFGGTLALDTENNAFFYRYAFVDYQPTDRVTLQVGQQDEPFSLQDVSGSRFLPFATSGQSAALIPGDTVGVRVSYGGDNHSISAGVFGGDVNNGVGDNGVALTGRVTWAPIYRQEEITRGGDATREGVGTQRVTDLLHLGLGLSTRRDIDGGVSFSGGTNATIPTGAASVLASSSTIAEVDALTRVNLEVARSVGSLSFQGELTAANVKGAREDGTAHGGYLYMTYFLTGEKRGYDRSSGTFGRVVPIDPIGGGGYGAVEVGLRADYLDLTDLGDESGRQHGLSAVANLYMTKRLTLTADYSYARGTAGAIDGTESHAVTARVQFAY